MEIFRGYKTELDPNNKQRTSLVRHVDASRFAYNWGLARRKAEYEATGKSSNAIEQHRQLNALKKTEFPWMYDVSKCAMQEALRDLDKAYQNFFRRIRKGNKEPGFPHFKSKKHSRGSFRLYGVIRIENDRIRLPRIGWLRLKEHGYIPTKDIRILSATVSEKACRWFVSVQCREEIEVTQAVGEPIGIDLGIKTMAVCSDGRQFENAKALRKAQHKIKRLQRELSRRKRGSQNYKRTKARIAKLYYQIANIRKDALHKATSAIVAKTKPDEERPSVVVIEDLNVRGMLQNHCLAQAIGDVGFAEFRRQLEYKTIWAGEDLVIADRFFPSSKMCQHCGCVNNGLTLADRKWACSCGMVLDRDDNAARNLKNLAVRRVPPELGAMLQTPVENDVRPTVVLLAASVKQELSIEPQ